MFLKRALSILMVFTIMGGSIVIPLLQTTGYASEVVTLYQDDFEDGNYSVVDGVAGGNKTKQLLKDGNLQWTFVKNGGTDLIGFPENPISNANASDTGKPVNTTTALYTTNDFKLNNNTIAYQNLPQKLTKGIVTLDFRMRRPNASEITTLNLYSEPFAGYSNASDKVAQLDFFANSSSRGRFRYCYEYRSETTKGTDTDIGVNDDNGTKMQGWPFIQMVINLDLQQITLRYSVSTAENMKEWGTYNFYANGTSSYHMANGISAISFGGQGLLGIDDVRVTYENPLTAPVASNIQILGATTIGTTLQGVYEYFDEENDPEDGSIGTWRRCPDDEFTTFVEDIKSEPVSATGPPSAYTLKEEDLGYYIQYSVVPKNKADENNVGIEKDAISRNPVRYAKTEPTVFIETPTDDQYVSFGQEVTFTSDAFCDNAEMTKVEYYIDDVKVGEATDKPYEYRWNSSNIGSFILVAKGYNNLQEVGVSEPITIHISPASHVLLCGDDGIAEIGQTISGNNNIYAKSLISNPTDKQLDVCIFLSFYNDENTLIEIGHSKVIAQPDTYNIPIEAFIEVKPELIEQTTLAKVLIWNPVTLENYMTSYEKDIIPDTEGMYDMDLYLLLGQSNMSGRAGIPSDCKPTLDRVYLFNNSFEWVGANNPFNRFNNLGEEYYKYSGKMNLGYPFSKILTEYVPNRKIGILNNAYGGSNLTQWEKGNAAGYYDKTISKAQEMLKYGRVKGILWHLGSSDMNRGYTRDEYIQKLNNFAKDLRTDLGDSTIPFIIGELAPTSEARIAFNEIFMSINQGTVHVPYSACVSAEGTVTYDGSHFDSASTKLLGKRYAKEILKMTYGIDLLNEETETTNLTANASPMVSSGASALNATDGNTDTYWISNTDPDFSYYILDLGEEYSITNASLTSRMNYNAVGERKNIQIQISNDSDFSTYKVIGSRGSIAYEYKGTWSCFHVDETKYRYVRVIKTDHDKLAFSELVVNGY